MEARLTKKTVVPCDCSDDSLAAVEQAVLINGDPSNVYVVHVIPEATPTELGMAWDTVSEEERKEHAVESLREQLSGRICEGVNIEILLGDPGTCVTQFAESIAADLIITSTHGRQGFKRLLLGSVAERIVRLAHCPVLILR